MLNPRRRATLAAVCSTFIPGWNDGGPDANPPNPRLLERTEALLYQIEDPRAGRHMPVFVTLCLRDFELKVLREME